jgi:hypothetical protein
VVSVCGVSVLCQCVVSVCGVSVLCQCVVSVCGVSVWCQCVVSVCGVSVWCQCVVSVCGVSVWSVCCVSVWCQCVVSVCGVSVLCQCVVSVCGISVWCQCVVLVCGVSAWWYGVLTWRVLDGCLVVSKLVNRQSVHHPSGGGDAVKPLPVNRHLRERDGKAVECVPQEVYGRAQHLYGGGDAYWVGLNAVFNCGGGSEKCRGVKW